MNSQEMAVLLEKARSNNERDNITGCLIYNMREFVQVLEGDREKILPLYERLKVDSRHIYVHLVSDDEIEERTFPNWGMAYYPIDEKATSKSELEQFRNNLLLLADLTDLTHMTARLFWKRIKFIITRPPESLGYKFNKP